MYIPLDRRQNEGWILSSNPVDQCVTDIDIICHACYIAYSFTLKENSYESFNKSVAYRRITFFRR